MQDAFRVLQPRSPQPVPLNPNEFGDSDIMRRLRETLGDFFAEMLYGDAQWARGVLIGGQDG